MALYLSKSIRWTASGKIFSSDGPNEDGDFEAIFSKRSIKIKDGFFIQKSKTSL